jgi:quercetin dioxygenase-like cupin family protein
MRKTVKQMISQFKARVLLRLESDNNEVNVISDIPKVWTKFMDSQNEWKGIDLKLDSTSLLFKGVKGSKVDKHLHAFSDERTYVLSGQIELITDEGISILSVGESFFVGMNNYHIVNFKEDTTLLAIFTPKMSNLEIEFK